MRRLFLALLLPLLVFGSSRHAEAARISFAGADCGSDPLLGLTFTSPIPVGGGPACAGFAFGSVLDPVSGLPAYGAAITSIGFTITNPTQIDLDNPLEVVDDPNDDDLATTSLGSGMTFTGSDGRFLVEAGLSGPIAISCTFPDITGGSTDRVVCSPPDVRIFIEGFVPGTAFRIVSVNGQSVPEPATLALLLAGFGAAAIRRRRRSTC